jgi:diguanylate cyclase (GGDEF)-like protein
MADQGLPVPEPTQTASLKRADDLPISGDGMEKETGSWLCPTEAERARMLEAGQLVRWTRVWVSLLVAVATAAAAPWLGWWPTAFGALTAVQVGTLERRTARSRRPERYVAASFLSTAFFASCGAAASGGPQSPLLFFIALPAILMANRFRRPVVIVGLAVTLLILWGGSVAVDPASFAHDPSLVIVATALVIGVVVFTLSLSDTELALRADARHDHLTGLFNRAALVSRFAELRSQAHATGGAIALVVYDLDRFKSVNDELGHDRGDAVLRDSAALLRRHLRAFDLVYRLGGEEFAVVLPGVGVAEALEIADRQRASIEQERPGGVGITISGGVASARGTDVEWDTLFQRADVALLRAKREGRNRVVVAADEQPSAALGLPVDPGAKLVSPAR